VLGGACIGADVPDGRWSFGRSCGHSFASAAWGDGGGSRIAVSRARSAGKMPRGSTGGVSLDGRSCGTGPALIDRDASGVWIRGRTLPERHDRVRFAVDMQVDLIKAIQAIKDEVSVKTYRSTRNQDLDKLLTRINQMLVGWAGYFRYGVSKAIFSAVDHHAWGRLTRWIRAKYKGKKSRLGMPEMRRRFCDQGWRFTYDGVVFTGAASVKVDRYRYRGSKIPTPWARELPAAVSG
jgi:hypothetical protein